LASTRRGSQRDRSERASRYRPPPTTRGCAPTATLLSSLKINTPANLNKSSRETRKRKQSSGAVIRAFRHNTLPFSRRVTQLAIREIAASLLRSWSGLDRGAPAPPTLSDQVTVLGLTNARFWADQGDALIAEGTAALGRERAANGTGRDGALPPANFLAI